MAGKLWPVWSGQCKQGFTMTVDFLGELLVPYNSVNVLGQCRPSTRSIPLWVAVTTLCPVIVHHFSFLMVKDSEYLGQPYFFRKRLELPSRMRFLRNGIVCRDLKTPSAVPMTTTTGATVEVGADRHPDKWGKILSFGKCVPLHKFHGVWI